ncbi:aldo/keto reductase [Rothia nasisuis]|uniref:aldo/keto reductase n=1 Tax=Rothia nasisuis TaxID=2109647 RepID=UPI001F1FAE5F|nr:aldo/keto reductase [Rothia nasisuis]
MNIIDDLKARGSFGFGAAQIGNLYRPIDDETAHRAVEAAWDQGIRYFDTAPHYGLGLSETRLGAVLATKPRDEFIVSTKVGRLLRPNPEPQGQDAEGFAVADDLTRVRDYSETGVLTSIEESLERTGLDRIDIVYIHDPDDHWEQASTQAVKALNRLKDEGVVRAWGIGMNQAEMLHRFVTETNPDLIMLAGRYTLLEQGAQKELLPACLANNVGVVNVGVFNSGLLSKPRPAADATYNYEPAPAQLIDRANQLADLAEKHGVTLPEAALAFPYQHPAVCSVVIGMRTAEQVTSNVQMHTQAQNVPAELWEEAHELGYITSHR